MKNKDHYTFNFSDARHQRIVWHPFYILLFLFISIYQINAQSSMEWVVLQDGEVQGTCASQSNCNNDMICYGLQYTPSVSGSITSYTTGFLIDCITGKNPVLSNASCIMSNKSRVIDECDTYDLILMNASGNTGTIVVTAGTPIVLHQVCFEISTGVTLEILEEEITNLTVSVDMVDAPKDEFPSFTKQMASASDCRLLPVEWLSFHAKKMKEQVARLEWRTASEINASHYEIEHSRDAKSFKVIGKVLSGNQALQTQQYEFFHQDAPLGENYYRIKQVDLDGQTDYTDIASVNFEMPSLFQVETYPNPAKDYLSLIIQSEAFEVKVNIIDVTGKQLKAFQLDLNSANILNISTLPAGVYNILVQTDLGEKYAEKLVIVKD